MGEPGRCPHQRRRRHLSTTRRFRRRAVVRREVSYSDDIGWDAHPGGLDLLRALAWRTRGFGDFWSHLLVAEGSVDVAVEPVLKPWDVAALLPIVTRAGGRLTGLDGSAALRLVDGDFSVPDGALTTNGHLTEAAVELLSDPS